jgi:hypothetical protein
MAGATTSGISKSPWHVTEQLRSGELIVKRRERHILKTMGGARRNLMDISSKKALPRAGLAFQYNGNGALFGISPESLEHTPKAAIMRAWGI